MRSIVIPALAAAAFVAVPAPALAQEGEAEQAAADLAERLSDPAEQERMAVTLATLSEIVLSMPIAPLAEAIENATGDDIPEVRPDATLRSLAGPRADRIAPEIERTVPRAMSAMAGMADGLRAIAPALREMADRMRSALPERAD